MIHYYYLGPMYAVSGGVVDSRMRATSVAITLFVVNLARLWPRPALIGILSTFLKTMFLNGEGLGPDARGLPAFAGAWWRCARRA